MFCVGGSGLGSLMALSEVPQAPTLAPFKGSLHLPTWASWNIPLASLCTHCEDGETEAQRSLGIHAAHSIPTSSYALFLFVS